VVVIGVDTLRIDAVGIHGATRDTTPELDAWASQFVVFDDAWAPAPRTVPSFRTAFTGTWPPRAAQAATLAERLAAHGFRTVGFSANVHLVARLGFTRGFAEWTHENGARAGAQVDRALAWLASHPDDDAFLFLHIMDPHTWYNAPEPWGSRFQQDPRPADLPAVFERWRIVRMMTRPGWTPAHARWIRAAYDGEVAYVSAQLDRFLRATLALAGDTLVVLHSDHGEEFWEHGGYEHNHTLYPELTRAALWIRPPGGWAGGPHRVAARASLADIVPTVMELVGAPVSDTDGISLAPFLREDAGATAALAARLDQRALPLGWLNFGTERWGSVSREGLYVLHTGSGQEERYDLTRDPRATRDLAQRTADDVRAAARVALAAAHGGRAPLAWRIPLGGSRDPVLVRFDGPVESVGVLDPEALRPVRANLEYGEAPPRTAEDVARVTLDAARTTLRIVPGRAPDGGVVVAVCAVACPQLRDPRPEGATVAPFLVRGVDTPTATPGLGADLRGALESLGYVDSPGAK
jgi:arylsulfatase A-like enzyme